MAMKNFSNDLTAATSYLFSKDNKNNSSIRNQLSEQLQTMGFEKDLCIKALKLFGDDVNLALNWLLEGNTIQNENSENFSIDTYDFSNMFLGSEISKKESENLQTQGMLENLFMKINENEYSDLNFFEEDNIVIINPYLKDENYPLLMKVKGN
jgi:uncharacterized UBP type Zn finger protein